ncbi:PorT family protein [candidate division KSB1 bacterium]|nr:PorT family protein [candidate division KSB1 bacterium]NIR70604.1 PorT family protein [candidate division KSB1 bacterium]NIS24549.1 PorT family protein [candidate division KSB1 bacterium]NIT71467.1 PorT family protein [candidate division KSB1 bacterium]NIU25158.1 PorT family protein [candidate division KSB1 bacterium]
MSRVLISFCVVLMYFSNGEAQLLRGVGFKAGVDLSTQEWEQINYFGVQNPDWDFRTGFSVGLFSEVFNHELLSAVVQISYNRKGFRGEASFPLFDEGAVFRHESKMEYLTFAIYPKLRMKAISSGGFNPYLFAGPSYGIFLSEKGSQLFDEVPRGSSKKISGSVIEGRNAWGALMGAGVELTGLAADILFVEISYSQDFSNISRSGVADIHNKSIELKMGILY